MEKLKEGGNRKRIVVLRSRRQIELFFEELKATRDLGSVQVGLWK